MLLPGNVTPDDLALMLFAASAAVCLTRCSRVTVLFAVAIHSRIKRLGRSRLFQSLHSFLIRRTPAYAVDPSEAKRFCCGLFLIEAFCRTAFMTDDQPDEFFRVTMFIEAFTPILSLSLRERRVYYFLGHDNISYWQDRQNGRDRRYEN